MTAARSAPLASTGPVASGSLSPTASRLSAGAEPQAPPPPGSFDALVHEVSEGGWGPDPGGLRVSVAFSTRQVVRHEGRGGGYRNEVLSLRLGEAVGSCAVEPGTLSEEAIDDCVSADIGTLLRHALLPVRVAALDAYLMHLWPHTAVNGARTVPLASGTSLEKSRARAAAVVDLFDTAALPKGARILVVGVVNSLLEALRARSLRYVPCDLKGGTSEWGEPIVTDALAELPYCDAVLASGMTLGNGTFDALRDQTARSGRQLVMFAQTGSAVLPRFLGNGVSAVCAEPYPFFWLDGGPGVLHQYRAAAGQGAGR